MQATECIVLNARLAYLHVFQPKTNAMSGKVQYSVQLSIPKDDKENIAKIKAAIDAATKMGADKGHFPKDAKKLNNPIKDGDAYYNEAEEGNKKFREHLRGCFFFNATSSEKYPPKIYDRYKDEITDEREVYAGMYGHVQVNFYPYGKGVPNKGISAGLRAIMKREDGDRLDGGTDSASAFEDFKDEKPEWKGDSFSGEASPSEYTPF